MGNSLDQYRASIGTFGATTAVRRKARKTSTWNLFILLLSIFFLLVKVLFLLINTVICCDYIVNSTENINFHQQSICHCVIYPGINNTYSLVKKILLVIAGIETHPGPVTDIFVDEESVNLNNFERTNEILETNQKTCTVCGVGKVTKVKNKIF